jgi:hypothetical protein
MGDRFYSLDEVRELGQGAHVIDPNGNLFLRFTPGRQDIDICVGGMMLSKGPVGRSAWKGVSFGECDMYPWILGA